MLDAGVFEGQRFERIDGDLIDKIGQKPPHMFAIQRFQELFIRLFGSSRVRLRGPMEAGAADLEKSMPEPDLAVLKEAKDEYQQRHPIGSEMTLVVEVADTTVRPDLTGKRDLYANAAVQEYWVLDLKNRRLVVHSGLDELNSRFASIQSYFEDETLDLAGQTVKVATLLA
jgi:Uma2 family endonuclease